MDYLYEREKELKEQIKALEKDCFNPKVKLVLSELRARHNEVFKAIQALEHEV